MIATLIWPVIVLLVAVGIEIRRRRGRRLRRLGSERRAYRALVDAAARVRCTKCGADDGERCDAGLHC